MPQVSVTVGPHSTVIGGGLSGGTPPPVPRAAYICGSDSRCDWFVEEGLNVPSGTADVAGLLLDFVYSLPSCFSPSSPTCFHHRSGLQHLLR